MEHSKGCDCGEHQVHQVSAHVGHFLVCSPGSLQLLSAVDLAWPWIWVGQTFLLLEQKQEHLAENILMVNVHFKILFSGFSFGKKKKNLVFVSFSLSLSLVVPLYSILTCRCHEEFMQDKVSMASGLLFVLFVTFQPRQTHHLNCLKNNPSPFCEYQRQSSVEIINCLQEKMMILQCVLFCFFFFQCHLIFFFFFFFLRTVCWDYSHFVDRTACAEDKHACWGLPGGIFLLFHVVFPGLK